MDKKISDKERIEINELISILNNIAPDFMEVIEKRYSVLRIINYLGPIGRRSLSDKLDLTERNIRTASTALKNQQLINITQEGMSITARGKKSLERLKYAFHILKGLRILEEELRDILNIKKVIIVPNSADSDPLVYKEMGKAASGYIDSLITEKSTIGLTGGTTIAQVINEYKYRKEKLSDVTVIPARGGLGKKVEYQANTLVQNLANKLGCNYKTLYTPDFLSQDSIESLLKEPAIKEIIELIEDIDILVFGIGRADIMAQRRGLSNEQIESLINKGAVSEAFGYYFNEAGEIVHEISTIGIDFETFNKIENIIAVAGGSEKAEAIASISKLNERLVLICDESVAKKIIFKYKEE
ncbi:sugar-binding transcriptional regulator [Paramaledivibacter caminithermalis]|uniref:Central glycolytic genes regulator n=1 Tax=Paramaledivibacter caminithermalis (strain DSM 15212 / CIP 107654 / DViRD3) TaxID=1121301 RepID=A0A1M6R5F5_PARC5|nr:sugar-binding domain-containing protein [Paramaledivibacter caminithermalis]SHK27719.1 central glycolytic genes regulator [Paramaledivibacter caminithermalis DSM 15212]